LLALTGNTRYTVVDRGDGVVRVMDYLPLDVLRPSLKPTRKHLLGSNNNPYAEVRRARGLRVGGEAFFRVAFSNVLLSSARAGNG
jgi:hypothetical protein